MTERAAHARIALLDNETVAVSLYDKQDDMICFIAFDPSEAVKFAQMISDRVATAIAMTDCKGSA